VKFPFPLATASVGWIAATGFMAVCGFDASTTTAWLICGVLSGLFGLTFLYLAWEFRRAAVIPEPVLRTERPSPVRRARMARGVPIYDRIQPTARLTINARLTARELRRARAQETTVGA